MSRLIDLTGAVFGRLTVTCRSEDSKRGDGVYWDCSCSCGGDTVVVGGSLRRKNGTKSCGCIAKERITLSNTTHNLYVQ